MTTPLVSNSQVQNYINTFQKAEKTKKYIKLVEDNLILTDKISESTSKHQLLSFLQSQTSHTDKRLKSILKYYFNHYGVHENSIADKENVAPATNQNKQTKRTIHFNEDSIVKNQHEKTFKLKGFNKINENSGFLDLADAFIFEGVKNLETYYLRIAIIANSNLTLESQDVEFSNFIEDLPDERVSEFSSYAIYQAERMKYYLSGAFNQAVNEVAILIDQLKINRIEIALECFYAQLETRLSDYMEEDKEGGSITMELATGTQKKLLSAPPEPLSHNTVKILMHSAKVKGGKAIELFFNQLILDASKFTVYTSTIEKIDFKNKNYLKDFEELLKEKIESFYSKKAYNECYAICMQLGLPHKESDEAAQTASLTKKKQFLENLPLLVLIFKNTAAALGVSDPATFKKQFGIQLAHFRDQQKSTFASSMFDFVIEFMGKLSFAAPTKSILKKPKQEVTESKGA